MPSSKMKEGIEKILSVIRIGQSGINIGRLNQCLTPIQEARTRAEGGSKLHRPEKRRNTCMELGKMIRSLSGTLDRNAANDLIAKVDEIWLAWDGILQAHLGAVYNDITLTPEPRDGARNMSRSIIYFNGFCIYSKDNVKASQPGGVGGVAIGTLKSALEFFYRQPPLEDLAKNISKYMAADTTFTGATGDTVRGTGAGTLAYYELITRGKDMYLVYIMENCSAVNWQNQKIGGSGETDFILWGKIVNNLTIINPVNLKVRLLKW